MAGLICSTINFQRRSVRACSATAMCLTWPYFSAIIRTCKRSLFMPVSQELLDIYREVHLYLSSTWLNQAFDNAANRSPPTLKR